MTDPALFAGLAVGDKIDSRFHHHLTYHFSDCGQMPDPSRYLQKDTSWAHPKDAFQTPPKDTYWTSPKDTFQTYPKRYLLNTPQKIPFRNPQKTPTGHPQKTPSRHSKKASRHHQNHLYTPKSTLRESIYFYLSSEECYFGGKNMVFRESWSMALAWKQRWG